MEPKRYPGIHQEEKIKLVWRGGGKGSTTGKTICWLRAFTLETEMAGFESLLFSCVKVEPPEERKS